MNLIFCMWLGVYNYINMIQFLQMGLVRYSWACQQKLSNGKSKTCQGWIELLWLFFACGNASRETANWFSSFKEFNNLLSVYQTAWFFYIKYLQNGLIFFDFLFALQFSIMIEMNRFLLLMDFGICCRSPLKWSLFWLV